ncbi:MAG: hypothetical protein EXR69_14290 [Myxococcales bacterium]|nr:hypothetical protein [Myxococcales bacterium]
MPARLPGEVVVRPLHLAARAERHASVEVYEAHLSYDVVPAEPLEGLSVIAPFEGVLRVGLRPRQTDPEPALASPFTVLDAEADPLRASSLAQRDGLGHVVDALKPQLPIDDLRAYAERPFGIDLGLLPREGLEADVLHHL